MTVPTYDGQSVLTLPNGASIVMDVDHAGHYNTTSASWMPQPDQHSTPQQNVAGGEVNGIYLDGGRTLKQTMAMVRYNSADQTNAVADREQLELFWSPFTLGEATLAWQQGGQLRQRYGVPLGLDVTLGKMFYESAVGTFRSENPRSYAVTDTVYAAVTTQTVTNPGTRPSIHWGITVHGAYTGATVTYQTVTGATNTLLLPDCPAGSTFTIDARRGEARITNDTSHAWTAVTGHVIDGNGTGFPARFMSVPVGDTEFHVATTTGTTVMDIAIRGCWS